MGGKSRWLQVGGLAGIFFALLIGANVFAGGQPPAVGASGKDVLAYLNAQQSALEAGWFLGGAATVFASLFFGVLTTMLWERGMDRPGVLAAFGAIVITGAIATTTGMFVSGPMAVIAGSLSEEQAKFLARVATLGNTEVTLMAGVSAGIFGLVMMRLKGAWKMTAYLGLLAAAVAVVAYAMNWEGGSSGLVGLAALLLFLLWSLVVGVAMLLAKTVPAAA